MYKLTERMWLNADRTKAVPEGDPEAAFFLGPAGREIPDAEAKQYGLFDRAKAEAPAEAKPAEVPKADEPAKAEAPEHDKKPAQAMDSKSIKPAENKAMKPNEDK